jgi:NADH:ubiquinone oxidoreductase subunit 6 (subunit J)
MLEAEFLAAIQVLVYVGAVAILLMFGIMLTRNIQGDDTTSLARGPVASLAIASCMGLFLILVFGINNHIGLRGRSDWAAPTYRPALAGTPRSEVVDNMGKTVGEELVNRYAVPFEVAGVLLTAALVGAIALAHRDPEDEAPTVSEAAGAAVVVPGPNGHGRTDTSPAAARAGSH